MIISWRLVLEILGLIAFALAGLNVASRFNLIAVGLFLWLLAVVVA